MHSVAFALAALSVALLVASHGHGGRPAAAAPDQALPCTASAWTKIAGVDEPVMSVAGQNDFEFMFAGSMSPLDVSDDHLFRGEVGDPGWLAVSQFASVAINDVVLGPGVDPDIWAASEGAYVSRDGGNTFRHHDELSNIFLTAMAPVTETVYVAGQRTDDFPNAVIYAYDPVSDTFRLRGDPATESQVLYDLEAGADATVWLGTDSDGLWRSDDAGQIWRSVDLPATDPTVFTVAADPLFPRRVYVGLGAPFSAPGAGARGIMVTTDNGVRWDWPWTDPEPITAMAPSQFREGFVHAAAWGRGLLVSRDGGATWKPAAAPTAFIEDMITVVPRGTQNCELLYTAGPDGVWVRNIATIEYTRLWLPHLPLQVDHAFAAAFGRPEPATEGTSADTAPRPAVPLP